MGDSNVCLRMCTYAHTMCVLVSIKDSYGMLSSCFCIIIYYNLNDYTFLF